MLWAATCGAQDGVVPVLHREELVLVQHVGRARHVAGHEDVLSVTTPLMSKARHAGVAADAPAAGCQSGAFQPLDVADRAERRHRHVDLERAPVGEAGTPQTSVRVALERRHRDAAAQVHAVLALHIGGDPRR